MPIGKVKILLVEDNEDHAYLFKKALNGALRERVEVILATDGEEAVSHLKQNRPLDKAKKPDFIFLDLKLPKKDGFEVLEAFKRDLDFKDIPIIILTSSDRADDIARGYALGANSYLSKPISATSLVKKVRRAVLYWLHVSNLPPRGKD